VVIVGRGPEEARLRRLARDSGAEDRLRIVDEADEEELLSLYAGARLVVVTAESEDYGYVPLEAFLSGKPVLAMEDGGGPLEFVRDGETGLVVPPKPESIGAALSRAWGNEAALRAFGQAGRQRVSGLSWDEPIAALLAAAGLS
jgi:glycosyltransferase involved in cell wall biosynthesis